MSTVERMRERLAALAPQHLEISDESALHAGHAGAREGGHYRLVIVSEHFQGLPTLARHRLVYETLGELMRKGIHALSITAATPDEFFSTREETP